MRYLILILTVVACGCDVPEQSDRQARRERRDSHRRRRVEPDEPIVKPTILGDVAEAQRLQITARATGMRELAAQYKAGTIKTVYDAHTLYLNNDRAARKQFDESLQKRLEKDLKQTASDDLPSNADVLFDAIAEEFETFIK